jgi:DNA-directed RNA polymerase specialized sigma24 family protein
MKTAEISKTEELKQERAKGSKYPLSTKKGIEYLLEDVPNMMESRFYQADLSSSDLLMDLELAIKKCGLSEVQRQTIHYLYFKDYTMETTAKLMDCHPPAVYKRKEKALEKLAELFGTWGYDNELY